MKSILSKEKTRVKGRFILVNRIHRSSNKEVGVPLKVVSRRKCNKHCIWVTTPSRAREGKCSQCNGFMYKGTRLDRPIIRNRFTGKIMYAVCAGFDMCEITEAEAVVYII